MKVRAAWLFSPRADLSILGIPLVLTLGAYLLALRGANPAVFTERAYATWLSQFLLGNTTHVILTYFLLAARRDVLHATPRQAHVVLFGSLAVMGVSGAFFWLTQRTYPSFLDFGTAVAITFATHHTLAQVKGLWSLYNMRSGIRPTERERGFQTHFVSLGLILILMKWFFVPKYSGSLYSFLQPIPGEPAFLPFWVTYVLLGAWGLYSVGLLRSVLARDEVSGPKVVYLAVHLVAVALTILTPAWGAILAAGIHGLEYYFLCGRMLSPTTEERDSRLRGWLVWPAMALVMAPLFVVGALNAPFTAKVLGTGLVSRHANIFAVAQIVLNSVVIAHYFADAFIYRFRIPEVRRVALARLGFA